MNAKLYITFDCNYDCSFCSKSDPPGIAMTSDEGKAVVDFVFKNLSADRKEVQFSFWGGEPLLNFPVMKDIADYAVELAGNNNKRVFFHVVTNGKIVNPEITDFLKQKGFMVDLHLTDEFFEPGIDVFLKDFKVHYGQWLRADPQPVLHLSITPRYIERLHAIVESLVGIGVKGILTEIGRFRDWTEQDIEALKKVYDGLAGFYIDKLRKGEDIFLIDFDLRLNNMIRPRVYKYCGAGINELAFTPGGNIYACLMRDGEKKIKPIGHIEGGFDAEERKKYLDYIPAQKETCKGCSLFTACLHDCPISNHLTTENMNATSMLVCDREQGLVDNATRFGNTLYQEKNQLFMKRFYSGHPDRGGKN